MISRFTQKEWLIVTALGSVNFACALCISLQAPFFPREAESKGSTASEYGLVFGVYELVAFICSPIYGKYMDRIGAKKIIIFGILLAGISSICFGLLDLINNHIAFISLAFVVRIFESLGTAGAITASYSITASVFQDSIATTFAVLKGFFGVGFMVGPTLGGFIYELSGFTGPFVLLGLMLLLEASLILNILPDIEVNTANKDNQVKIFSVLRLTPVFLDLFSTTAAAMTLGFIFATLEPHIRQFNLRPVATGSVFVLGAATYALSAPLVGYLCDTRCQPKKVIILGGVLIIVGFTLIGPAPYLPFKTNLWLVCVGLVFHGLGNACMLVPSFIDAIHSAVACGQPNNMALYGVISGLATSAFALGDTIGPSVAGILFDAVGFRQGTLFVIATQLLLVTTMTTQLCVNRRPAQNDAQETSNESNAEPPDEHTKLTSASESNGYIN